VIPEKTTNIYYDLYKTMDYVCRMINSSNTKRLHRIGLSHEIAGILSAVYRLNNNAMPVQLSRYGKRKPQSITESLNKMEKRGLIIKIQDGKKMNKYRVSLTEKGLATYTKVTNITTYNKVMSSLTEQQIKQLQECLDILKEKAEKVS
jgi:DNA-binding MarR family transcriptional regulator